MIGERIVGVGVDLVEVDRMRAVLARTPGFARRVFTAGEQADARRRRDPAQRLAARFAAKEALLKAFGVGLGAISLADIEVVLGGNGRPGLVLHGSAGARAAALGVARCEVSLTHTDSMAEAVVVAIGSAP